MVLHMVQTYVRRGEAIKSMSAQLQERYFSVSEAAELLKVHRNTVGRYIKDGRLPGYRVGNQYRIPESTLTRFMEETGDQRRSDRARVVAIANQKGGVAKTTTAVNLAAALACNGSRTLLIDLDPQAGCALLLGIQAHTLPKTVYDVLRDSETSIAQVTIRTEFGFDLVPANIYLAEAELTVNAMMSREYLLRRKLEPVLDDYDVIVIDTPPTLGILTINALAAADEVLIPAAAQYMSLQGLDLLLGTVSQVKRNLNEDLSILGILPTMYDRRTTHAQEVVDYFETLSEQYGAPVLPYPIYSTVQFQRAPNERMPMILLNPEHEASRHYVQLAEEVIGDR